MDGDSISCPSCNSPLACRVCGHFPNYGDLGGAFDLEHIGPGYQPIIGQPSGPPLGGTGGIPFGPDGKPMISSSGRDVWYHDLDGHPLVGLQQDLETARAESEEATTEFWLALDDEERDPTPGNTERRRAAEQRARTASDVYDALLRARNEEIL